MNKRFCTQCRQWHNSKDGLLIKFNKGLNHRWICAICKKIRELKKISSAPPINPTA